MTVSYIISLTIDLVKPQYKERIPPSRTLVFRAGTRDSANLSPHLFEPFKSLRCSEEFLQRCRLLIENLNENTRKPSIPSVLNGWVNIPHGFQQD